MWQEHYIGCVRMQGVQALFEQCQASMDPNSIAHLLAHHPYHIDALLAMFELYRCALLAFLHHVCCLL